MGIILINITYIIILLNYTEYIYNMDKEERIKKINQENIIWIICLFLILFSLYGNTLEKKYFEENNIKSKEKYIKIQITIFTVALFIYIFFFIDSYKDLNNLTFFDSKKKKQLTQANYIASTLVLIAGTILLVIAIIDEDLEAEISFT